MVFRIGLYLLVSIDILTANTSVATANFIDGSVLPRVQRSFRYPNGNVASKVPRAMSMKNFNTYVVGQTWRMLYFLEQPVQFDAINARQKFTPQKDGSVYYDITYRTPSGCHPLSFTSIPKSRTRAIFITDIPAVNVFSREDRLFSRRPSHYIYLWLCDQEDLSPDRLLRTGGVCRGNIVVIAYVREFPLRRFPLGALVRELRLETGLRFSDSRFTFRTGEECP